MRHVPFPCGGYGTARELQSSPSSVAERRKDLRIPDLSHERTLSEMGNMPIDATMRMMITRTPPILTLTQICGRLNRDCKR
jgi:hypothetical protein